MPYIILFTVLSIFIVLVLAFQWILRDEKKQYYIAGLFLCYGLCTIVRHIPAIADTLEATEYGLSVIVFSFFLMLSVWCTIGYIMQIINSKTFRIGVGIAMTADGAVMAVSVALWQMHVQSYHKVFIISIFVIGILSIIYSIVFAVMLRDSFDRRDKAYLIVAYMMIAWFMTSLVMNLTESKYMYVGGGGLVIYCILYLIDSVLRVRHKIIIAVVMSRNAAHSGKPQFAEPTLNITNLSHSEIMILDIMALHNVFTTHGILPYLSEGTSGSQVDSILSALMQRVNVYTRQELTEIYKLNN